ncbi:hypothetical protein C7212DRAFT_322750 [Tuber magnatum]|uniref:Uncharacterized protein n=1 Tax=Tuber magnatum TaxID=42249 RepID=A0A317SLV4_9PEZI|nr:hypothetical protein C7212DRAFT_322750 [Tuber magnatum]
MYAKGTEMLRNRIMFSRGGLVTSYFVPRCISAHRGIRCYFPVSPQAKMVSGLIYCDVDGNVDHSKELEAVMASLTTAARSISPVQVRTYAKPKTVYTNEPGCSLLQSLQTMASKIDVLQKKTEVLSEKVAILGPLKNTAVDIRKRFFATFRRKKRHLAMGDRSTIASGNNRAHARDVCTDVSLFRNKLICSGDTFTALYGLHWREAGDLLEHKHLVYAMNKRATAVTNRRRWDKEGDFRELVLWTKNATPAELEEFRNDVAGELSYKRLFLSIMHSR